MTNAANASPFPRVVNSPSTQVSYVNLSGARPGLTNVVDTAESPRVPAARVLFRRKLSRAAGLVHDHLRRPIRVVELFIREGDGLCRCVEAADREHCREPGNLSFMLHDDLLS